MKQNNELGVPINLKVGDLKEILRQCPDDMDIIIPVITEEDCNNILAFRHARTVGILKNDYEPEQALCINAAADGLDISSQIKRMDTVCTRVMF